MPRTPRHARINSSIVAISHRPRIGGSWRKPTAYWGEADGPRCPSCCKARYQSPGAQEAGHSRCLQSRRARLSQHRLRSADHSAQHPGPGQRDPPRAARCATAATHIPGCGWSPVGRQAQRAPARDLKRPREHDPHRRLFTDWPSEPCAGWRMSIKDEWVELVGKSIAASAKDAQSKSPDELTNEEKFALAIMAG